MRFIYLILVCFAAPVAALIAWLRGLRDPSRRERIADRFGKPRLSLRPPVFWVHAASMGEVQAGAVLVRRLLTEHPSHRIVMTTMTTTGADRVTSQFPDRVAHCFLPYDLPFAVRGFLDRVRPQQAIILETELWPNLLGECSRRRIPVVIASARISPRTANRYRRFSRLFSDALAEVAVAAQSDSDAERFKELGAESIQVTGNLKFDIEVAETVRNSGAMLRAAIGSRFIWVAGSTHAGEESAALDAHRELRKSSPEALLILVPRHPPRFEEVRALLMRSDLSFVTRSSNAALDGKSVLLVDTMGELLNCYAAADLAFVGGSLVNVGGHNLLEPAALGVATVCGSHMQSAQDVFDRLMEANGVIEVSSSQHLSAEVKRLAADAGARQALGERALNVLRVNRGATERTLQVISAAVSLPARQPRL